MTQPRIQAVYDTDPERLEDIASYMHCTKCLAEMPIGESPRSWSRLQMGIRPDGHFQVVCVRHNCNVAVITLRVTS